MIPNAKQHTLDELSEETGISARTIRSYVTRGLIPRPERGRGATYEPQALDRLNAIKRLLKLGCTLDHVKSVLDQFGDDDEYIHKIGSGEEKIQMMWSLDASTYSREMPEPDEEGEMCASMPAPQPAGETIPGAEHWQKISITEDIELSIRFGSLEIDQESIADIIDAVQAALPGHRGRKARS